MNTLEDLLLDIIPGESSGYYTEKHMDIDKHISRTSLEFCGQPLVCLEVAKLIILIRRKQDIVNNYDKFYKLCNEYTDVICKSMTTRWLVSVLDTIFDHGEPHQKAGALSVSVLVNMLIVSDTIMACLDASEIPEKPFDTTSSTEYGCMFLNTRTGDNIRNFINRVNLAVEPCEVVSKIWKEIFCRIQQTKNSISLLKKLHKGKRFF